MTTADALKSRIDRSRIDALDFLKVNRTAGIEDAERLRADILRLVFDPSSLGRDLLSVIEAQRRAVAEINTAIDETLMRESTHGA